MLAAAASCLQITALKNLGLNIRKAALKPGSKASTLFVTDATTSEKILKSSRLEEIRMTIINNMLYFHPVSPGIGPQHIHTARLRTCCAKQQQQPAHRAAHQQPWLQPRTRPHPSSGVCAWARQALHAHLHPAVPAPHACVLHTLCLLQESSENLAAGKSMAIPKRDQTHPLGPKARAVVQTTIEVREAPNGSCSILDVVTADR